MIVPSKSKTATVGFVDGKFSFLKCHKSVLCNSACVSLDFRNPSREAEQTRFLFPAVTNARLALLHGLPVVPATPRRRPFHSANRALVTSLHGAGPQERRASGCGSAAGHCAPAAFHQAFLSASAPLSPLAARRPKPHPTTLIPSVNISKGWDCICPTRFC